MDKPVIETRGLSKRYGDVVAVKDLSLSVETGGVFGLLGPNGSGKTTTMGMLLGLVRPTAGSIRLFNEPEGVPREALHRIGAIVESPAFYPHLSGRSNLCYFQGILGGRPSQVDQLLDSVGLLERADSRFSTYSLGMKQRLGVAYALLGDPELIFLDEPTNGLDPAGMAEVRDLIKGLGTEGRTVLLSSHLLHEVELVCDSVAILSRGELIAQGRVADLVSAQAAIRFKTTDDDQARLVVSALDWVEEVREEGGYLLASAPAERSHELTAALAQHDVWIREMAPVEVSLERYFLEVTGSDANEETEGGQ
ncbi:MAG: ABC-2 type transport system ATP-binding protein [Chloroflexi bacterium]|nr:MAG: ABC-2 type transport system ATP-binding protein [Chloroflexota bacterium]